MTLHRITQVAYLAHGLLLASSVVFAGARAHEAHTGMVYPPECCHSAATHPNGDCAPIPSMTVVARKDGYHVNLSVGQHPKLKNKGYSGVVPYSVARPTDDGAFHICLSPDGGARYCFFAPGPGV